MRETLTVLAGLLVLTLLAALIGPGFVDWRDYRSQIEARLTETLGVETRVGGGIGLRLLPSPVLTLQDVRIGTGSEASSATAERVGVEFALSALARGEFRFADAQADGATVSIVLDETGSVRWPQRRGAGLPTQASLDRLTVRRSMLVWRDADRAPVVIAPISADLAASSLAGPWRIEGEAAGSSFRITTGAVEENGRLRAKAFVTGDDTQLSFDGQFLLPVAGGEPGLEGAFTLSPGGAVSLAGQVRGGARQLDIAGLSFDVGGGAARLEGEGQYLPQLGKGSLALRARRLDLDMLATALGERPGFEHGLQALPGSFDIALDLDQLLWRGEDFSALALRGRLDEGGLDDVSASVRVAGALIGASGRAGFAAVSGRINVKAEDARRVALALARAGLDPALADLVAGLGRIDAEAMGGWEDGRIGFQRLLVTGSSGLRLEGSGDLLPGRLVAKAALKGLDLNTLPPGANFAALVGRRDLALDLSLTDARFRNAPPGSANLALRREGETWRLDRFNVEGFGGVAVSGSGALLVEGGEISGRVRAPRFEALAALAGPLLPEQALQAAARLGDGLARLDAGFRVTRAAAGEAAVTFDGAAQAGRLAFDGRLDRAGGGWSAGNLRFDLTDRRQAFAALGLPTPAQGGAGRFTLELGPQRLQGSLSGPGLSLVAESRGAEPARLVVQAESAGQILPEAPARLLPEGVLDAHARLALSSEAVTLDDLVVNLGGASARGALVLPREGAYRGRLALPTIDVRALLGASLGSAGARAAGTIWSSARFGTAAPLPDFEIAVEAGTLTLFEGTALQAAKLTLKAQNDGLRIDDVSGGYGGGRVEGRLSLRREGGLAQLAGRIALRDVDLAAMTGGALAGKASGQLDAGGAGESPARLVAGLSGAGNLTLGAARLARFDPTAYAQMIAGTGEDASESDPSRLQDRLSAALDRDAWLLGDVGVPFTLAGGLVRLQPFAFERGGLRAEASGTVDLRGLSTDLRLSLKPVGPLPKGWPGEAPQIGIAWRGPLSGLRRESDVGALSNTVAARALAREIERVEAFEADARERAIHSRRLRAERETRENERRLNLFLKAEEERRLAEEKRAEEARRIEEARLAEDARRAEETRRAEQVRLEQEMRRRLEAEERMRAATPPSPPPQPGPLILQGAPRSSFSDNVPTAQEAPALPPPLQIESVPRPLSRAVQPN